MLLLCAHVLCDYCECSDHNAYNGLYRDYVNAACASLGKIINEMAIKMLEAMKERIAEYSHYFNQNRDDCIEPDLSLESSKPEVSRFDDFEPSYLTRPDLHDDISFSSLGPLCVSIPQPLT